MRSELAELWLFRGLLWQLVRRDLKVRYKNSRLGFFWSIAPPLMQVAVITVVFKYATNFAKDVPSYSAYVLVAMIPWVFFQTAILDSCDSILKMYDVIRKVYMPREIIPLASVLSNSIHFLISWCVFFIYWWGFRGGPILPTALWLLYIIPVQVVLVTAISLVVSCLNVFYEDIKYIVSILMNVFFYLVPIIYIVEMLEVKNFGGNQYHALVMFAYNLNPMTIIINGYRKALLQPPMTNAFGTWIPLNSTGLLATGVFSLLALVWSYGFFNRRKWRFVERP